MNPNFSRHFFLIGFGHFLRGGGVDPNPNTFEALFCLNLDFMNIFFQNFFLIPKKCRNLFSLIMLKFRQKSSSKVFGLGSTPPPPAKCPNTSRKKCLEQFGFRLDPLPHPFGQIRTDFFTGCLPQSTSVMSVIFCNFLTCQLMSSKNLCSNERGQKLPARGKATTEEQ